MKKKFFSAFRLFFCALCFLLPFSLYAKTVVGYQTLTHPLTPLKAGEKIEIIEFFFYLCPHCAALDPVLTQWAQRHQAEVKITRIPVAFNDQVKEHQALYYTLQVLGKDLELAPAVFNEIHKNRNPLLEKKAQDKFLKEHSIDQKNFSDIKSSFSVKSKIKQADDLVRNYQINGVPTLIVQGKYLTSPSFIQSTVAQDAQTEQQIFNKMFEVLDQLIIKIRKEKGG